MAEKTKSEILEEARAKSKAALDEADAKASAEAQAEAEAELARSQAEAAERAAKVREAMVDEATPRVTAASPETPATVDARTQGSSEWGPYDQYEIVSTRYGQFAVEPGYKMFFEEYEFFDDREKRLRRSQRPVYIWALPGKNFGKTRDEIVRGFKPPQHSTPVVTTR